MNRQNNKSRTLLNLSTLNDIMRICVDGSAISEFVHVNMWKNMEKGVLKLVINVVGKN